LFLGKKNSPGDLASPGCIVISPIFGLGLRKSFQVAVGPQQLVFIGFRGWVGVAVFGQTEGGVGAMAFSGWD
jgi:hypothetical protein